MLLFSYIEESEPVPSTIPPPKANGGLDTGKQASGPWGNYPVLPEPVALSRNLLSEANVPPNAEKQPVTFLRPGNNPVEYPYHHQHQPGVYNFRCM